MPNQKLSQFRRLKCVIRGWQQALYRLAGTVPTTELLFQSMFNQMVRDLNGAANFYPVGSAANYSLLYIVHRVLMESDVASALDIGAGQTTVLFDLLASVMQRELHVATVESDEGWAGRMQARVRHKVLFTDLIDRDVHGHNCRTYADWPTGTFDFVVVDGPNKATRRSRWGVLGLLDTQLSADFVVVFDDATRPGELDTIQAFLRSNDRIWGYRFLHGTKSQCVIYSAKFAWLETLY